MTESLMEELRGIVRSELERAMDINHYPKELLTSEEVAKMLKIKPQTLCIWRSKGNRGPNYQKISDSSAVRYKYKEVQRWIDKQTIKVQ